MLPGAYAIINFGAIQGTIRNIYPDPNSRSGDEYTHFFIEIETATGKHTVRTNRTLIKNNKLALGLQDITYGQLLRGKGDEYIKRVRNKVTIRVGIDAQNKLPSQILEAKSLSVVQPYREQQKLAEDIEWTDLTQDIRFTPVPPPAITRNQVRIGYAIFDCPINHVSSSRSTQLQQIPLLRQQGSLKKGSGKAYETYTIQYIAQGPAEIKSAVKDVIDQISLTPFITVDGGPFGFNNEIGDIPHKSIAVRNFSISTVPGLPNAISVQISFDPFIWEWYTPPTLGMWPRQGMDDMICWPLFKIWATTREKSVYSGDVFNGSLEISYPNPDTLKDIDSLFDRSRGDIINQDVNAINSLLGLVAGTLIDKPSKFVKELQNTRDSLNRYFVLKLKNAKIFDEFINNPLFNKYFRGLTRWEPLDTTSYRSDTGQFVPNSTLVDIGYLTKMYDLGKPSSPDQFDVLGVVEIQRVGKRFDTQITELLLSESDFLGIPDETHPEYNTYKQHVEPVIERHLANKHDYYGVVLGATVSDVGELSGLLKDLIARNRSGEVYEYGSIEAALRDMLESQEATTTVLSSYSGSDILIESISGTKGHNLALYNNQLEPLPIHQYMGGLDGIFVVEGKCFGSAAKKKLEEMKADYDSRVIGYKDESYSPEINPTHADEVKQAAFLKVDNEIFQLLGTHFAMPITLEFNSIDGQPNVWHWQLSFIDYDPKILKSEKIRFLQNTWAQIGKIYVYSQWGGESNPIVDKAIEFLDFEKALSQEEIYPDMALPAGEEVDFWIDTIKKASEAIVSNDPLDKVLTPQERVVASMIPEFLQGYANRMARWKARTELIKNPATELTFADPDFYCYYEKEEMWQNIFDGLSQHLMGKRKGAHATGIEGQTDNAPVGPYTEYDSKYEGVTVHDSSYWAVNSKKRDELDAKTNEIERNMAVGYMSNTHPPERFATVRQLMQNYVDQYDQTEGAWWGSLQVQSYATADEEAKKITLEAKDDEALLTGLMPSPRLVPQKPKRSGEVNNNGEYFSFRWRQEQIQKQAETGLKAIELDRLLPIGNHLLAANPKFYFADDTVFFSSDSAVRNFFDSNNFGFGGTTVGEFVEGTSGLRNIERLIRAHTRDELSDRKETNVKDLYDGEKVGMQAAMVLDKARGWTYGLVPFIIKTGLVNANFKYVKNTKFESHSVSVGGNIKQNFKNTWNFIDAVSLKHKIDPNILRGVFLKRDGMGANVSSNSKGVGFGDLSPAVGLGSKSDGAVKHNIQVFAEHFGEHLKRYGFNTLALIATHITTTVEGAKFLENGKIREPVDKALLKARDFIGKDPYTNESKRQIESLLSNLPGMQEFIDSYYFGYLEVSRAFGAYYNLELIKGQDMYFSSMNGLIVIDGLFGGEHYMLHTKHTPSGKTSQGLNTDTEDVYKLPAELRNQNKENLSLEEANRFASKQRIGLDPLSEAGTYGALKDLREHAPFGRLLGAFPSFFVSIINEGFYWAAGPEKLWDQFYTRTGIGSIEIFRSRKKPGSTCSVVFSNIFHKLTAYTAMEALQQDLAVQTNDKMKELLSGKIFSKISTLWREFVLRSPSKDIVQIWQNNHLKKLVLTAGARLHVRMGYGANAAKLPTVFNGTVVSAPADEGYVEVFAVSDGFELEKPTTTKLVKSGNAFAFQDGAFAGQGKDPSSIITEAIVAGSFWDNLTRGRFRDFSQGIAHFGEIYYADNRHYPAEVQINIYSSRQSKLEQGISSLQQYFSANAITNFGKDVNLFSVEVQEPSIWKVSEVCRRAMLDYVASSEYFALRSTLFFGKPWWPYHYSYDERILDLFRPAVKPTRSGFPNRALPNLINLSPRADKAPDVVTNENSNKVQSTNPLVDSGFNPQVPTPGPFDYFFGGYFGQGIGFAREITVPINTFRRAHDLNAAMKAKMNHHPAAYSFAQTLPVNESIIDFYIVGTNIPMSGPKPARVYEVVYRITTQNNASPFKNRRTYEFGLDSLTKEVVVIRDTSGSISEKRIPVTEPFNPIVDAFKTGTDVTVDSVNSPTDIFLDVNELTQYLKWKPLMQCYIAHSALNLLDNNISADSQEVMTDAVGLHIYNGVASPSSVSRTITFSVDTDITAADRKTMLVDTGLFVTGLQSGLRPLQESFLRLFSFIPVLGGAADYVQQTPTTPAVENAVVSALVDQVKEMYQGWFVMMAQSTIKPRDMILLTDHKTGLRGPVFVKEVVHRMDTQTGFVTIVSPDACVFSAAGLVGQKLVTSLCAGILSRLGGFMLFKAATAATLGTLRYKWVRRELDNLNDPLARYNRILRAADNLRPQVLNQYKALANLEIYKEVKKLQDIPNKSPDQLARLKLLTEKATEMAKIPAEPGRFNEVINILSDLGIDDTEIRKAADFEDLDEAILHVLKQEARLQAQYADTLDTIANSQDGPLKHFDQDELLRAAERDLNVERAKFANGPDSEVISKAAQTLVPTDSEVTEAIDELKELARKRALGALDDVEEAKFLRYTKVVESALDSDVNKLTYNQLDSVLREVIDTVDGSPFRHSTESFGRRVGRSVFRSPFAVLKGIVTAPIKILETIFSWSNSAGAAKSPSSRFAMIMASKRARDGVKESRLLFALDKVRAESVYKMASLRKTAKGVLTGVRLAKYMGPQLILALAADAAITLVGGGLIEGWNARTKARQSVKIIPLTSKGVPFVAGIRGHQGAVIGDNPSWTDELITGLHGGPTANGEYITGGKLLMVLNALLGVDVPDYSPNEVDQAWIEHLKKEGLQSEIGEQVALPSDLNGKKKLIDVNSIDLNKIGVLGNSSPEELAKSYSNQIEATFDAQLFSLGFNRSISAKFSSDTSGTLINTQGAPWMAIAQKEIGVVEFTGKNSNQRILEYHKTTGNFSSDGVPWCSSFINWVLEQVGIKGTGSASSQSWLNWGIASEQYGSIVVFSKGNGFGHVGFLIGREGDKIQVLGGNQSNQVKVSSYPLEGSSAGRVISYRWPG